MKNENNLHRFFLNFSARVSLGEITSGNALQTPIQVAARVKALVCGRSLAGIAGSNPEGGTEICLL
jgi:hypothetical protein